jgi:hypothetical protein
LNIWAPPSASTSTNYRNDQEKRHRILLLSTICRTTCRSSGAQFFWDLYFYQHIAPNGARSIVLSPMGQNVCSYDGLRNTSGVPLGTPCCSNLRSNKLLSIKNYFYYFSLTLAIRIIKKEAEASLLSSMKDYFISRTLLSGRSSSRPRSACRLFHYRQRLCCYRCRLPVL